MFCFITITVTSRAILAQLEFSAMKMEINENTYSQNIISHRVSLTKWSENLFEKTTKKNYKIQK